jgi:RNase adaptor protein for sRNA GlmZ degradation
MDKLSALHNAAHEVAHKILEDRGYLQEEKFPQEFANEFKEWLFHDQTRMIAILERARIKTI